MYENFNCDLKLFVYSKIYYTTESKFETSEEEMKFYIGFLIGMGIESKIRFEDYWSSDPFLENVYIKSRISRQRVRDISHNFHLNMIKDENPADKLSKVCLS